MPKEPNVVITVATANEDAARALFLAAGFTDFKVVQREGNLASFMFNDVRDEDSYRLTMTIPTEMYAYKGFVCGRMPKLDEAP